MTLPPLLLLPSQHTAECTEEQVLEEHMREIQSLYENDKLFMAQERIDHFLRSIAFYLSGDASGVERQRLCVLRERFCSWGLVERVQGESREARRLLEQMNDYGKKEGSEWELAYETADDVSVFYQHESQSKNHAIRIEGTIEAPIFNLLAIFYEIELYQHWVPKMKHCSTLKQLSPYRLLCHFGFNLPWPFADRDCVCLGYGVDMLETEDQSILVVVKSVQKDDDHLHTDPSTGSSIVPPVEGKDVRLDVQFAGFLVEALSAHRTRIKIITKIDPKVKYLPQWLQNTVLRYASPYVLRTLRKMAISVPDNEDFRSRMQEKEMIYGDIRNRLERLFSEKNDTLQAGE